MRDVRSEATYALTGTSVASASHDGTATQCLTEPDAALAHARRRQLFLVVINAYTETDSHA